MDSGNWRPTLQEGGGAGEPTMEAGDWRAQLPQDSRQRIVNKIMEILKKHLPVSGPDGLSELKKIALRFEEKIYTAATSQQDYLRKISLKMLIMETKSENSIPNSLPPNPPGSSSKPPELAPGLQQQILNQSQSIPNSLAPSQSQTRQQLLSQNIQTNIPSAGVQGSTSISTLPPVSGLGQNTNMQNMSNVPQISLGNQMGQGLASNMFVNSQRQMPGRQQVVAQQLNPQQYLMQQQLLKQKLQQQNNMSHSLMSPQIPQQPQQMQQPQQSMLQPNQLQSHQQSLLQTSSVMPPSSMQQAPLPGLQPNQQSSLQQPSQSMIEQHVRQQHQSQAGVHQQQPTLSQPPMLTSQQQQQQMVGQKPNVHQNQLMNQQNSMGDMQQPQQRLISQQNNLQSLQPQQQQQQLIPQQNNLPNIHSQQLASQTNVSGLHQQQPLLGSQAGTTSMPAGQHPVHILQQPKVPIQQQLQPSGLNLLPSQGQQSQLQALQEQMMSQIQPQPAQLPQQVNLQQQTNSYQCDMQQQTNSYQCDMQQQTNSYQCDMQQRLQASGSLLQSQNLMDQQKQLYQSQRSLPEASSMPMDTVGQGGHANGSDWQEEVYQKIKSLKEMYLPEINEMYQKIAPKLQQIDSVPQQAKSDQLERLKTFRTMLERIISFLQVSKNDVVPVYKEKLASYERQIINFINTNRPRKNPALQQVQIQQPIHPIQQQQSQSQMSQVQSQESQMNSQMQPMNLPGPGGSMQQNNMASLQHSSVSSMPGVSNAQQSMIALLQPNSSMDAAQGNAMNSLQQVTAGSMQQNAIVPPQQVNVNSMSSQSGVTMMQSNISGLQSNPNLLQHQHLKQQQELQMLQSQQLKQQFQQCQIQLQQQMQKQQFLQHQLHQQAKQQLPAQLQTHPMPQLHQMNDVIKMKVRPGMGVKTGVFQQHHAAGQCSAYSQQLKRGASFPLSLPPLLQAASPQIPQHSSPQIDQQNLLSSLTKTGTPLQSASSPFVVPSPATPVAPSPMLADSEKPTSGDSSLANSGNLGGLQQAAAIGIPGISASPLLAKFGIPDAAHGNASVAQTGKSTRTERPIEWLIKAVVIVMMILVMMRIAMVVWGTGRTSRSRLRSLTSSRDGLFYMF